MAEEVKRMNYFDGLFLREQEFNLEQNYHIRMRRLHNRHLHSWGIVWGLEVTAKTDIPEITVSPGMALNSVSEKGEDISQEIVIPMERSLDLSSYVPPTSGETVNGYICISFFEAIADIEDLEEGNKEIWIERPVIEFKDIDFFKNKPEAEKAKHIILAKVEIFAPSGGSTGSVIIDEAASESERKKSGLKGTLETEKLTLAPEDESNGFASIEYETFETQKGIKVTSPHTHFTGPVNIVGKVGIGTETPSGMLDVGGGNLVVVDGNVGVGKTDPGEKLDINGNLNISGNANISGNCNLITNLQTTINKLKQDVEYLENLVLGPRITEFIYPEDRPFLFPKEILIIKGWNFDSSSENNIVKFNNATPVNPDIASQIQLNLEVPSEVAIGTVTVTVEVNERVSPGVDIEIRPIP